MFSIFKQRRKYPPFTALETYSHKHSYFVRNASWNWIDSQMIMVWDQYRARVHTMDPWPQTVFLAADGQLTVSEYIYWLASKYSGEIPELLDAQIIEELDKLVKEGIVAIVQSQQRPDETHDTARIFPKG